MSKTKKTYEEVIELQEVAKTKLGEAKEALKIFRAENKIKRNKPIEDEKLQKAFDKVEAKVTSAKEAFDALKAEAKALKPKTTRGVKYTYPEGMDDANDRKKYRAKMRREAKRAEAGDNPEKPAKESKADKPSKKVKAKKKTTKVEKPEED